MSESAIRRPVLTELYDQFLADRDHAAFVHRVAQRYNTATLERLTLHRSRWARRAAVLALGAIADYASNNVLGHALIDSDRGVRWHRRNFDSCRLVPRRQLEPAAATQRDHRTECRRKARCRPRGRQQADRRKREAGRSLESTGHRLFAVGPICRIDRRLPPHARAESVPFRRRRRIGQCLLQLGEQQAALDNFRHALKINPGLEGVRANVVYLQKVLKKK